MFQKGEVVHLAVCIVKITHWNVWNMWVDPEHKAIHEAKQRVCEHTMSLIQHEEAVHTVQEYTYTWSLGWG